MIRTNTTAVALAVMLGATLMAAPGSARASHGEKWWTPREGRIERWRDPGPRGFSRQWRSWGGRRVYRDMIVIRASRGPRYRAWRTYSPPEFVVSRRIIHVRPVRFAVASAYVGGVHFHGSYCDDPDVYGCNFCDARFGTYEAYHAHVMSCSHRPYGYRVECSDWSAGAGWGDDGWRRCDDWDDDHGRYCDHDRDDDHGGRWDQGEDEDDDDD